MKLQATNRHLSIPDVEARYRESTQNPVMGGVTIPTFKCKQCKQFKLTAGRKLVVPKTPRYGYHCNTCIA